MNEELKKMYEDDVREKTEADWDDKNVVSRISKNDKDRRKKVKEIISAGGLEVGADYHHAALIFQHGDTTSDYRKANKLAERGMELGDERSKWFYAATMDRWLVSTGKPQKYGTQFHKKKNGDWEVGPIDKNVSDKERAKYNVPPLSKALSVYKKKYGFK